MDLAIYDAPDLIGAIWRRLEAVARPPYAQSWGWIENWLASLENHIFPHLGSYRVDEVTSVIYP